ncbi:MAG TPA: hypothetical protein VIG06_20530 [Kofleriaceae bacterium]
MRRAALIGAILVAACGAPGDNLDGTWTVDHTVEGGALLSVWGSAPDDVWAGGGTTDRGVVLHGDGETWTELDTGASSMLWWVYGFSSDDVYAVGERGLILHYDGSSWQRAESGTDLTLYGVWGASGDDVWIVGGDPITQGSAVILRGHGTSFSRVTDLPSELAPGALFKAYGYAADDVILVGSGGAVLRWNGTAWRREAVPTSEPLFSLWGRAADDLFAVGGWTAGTVLHFAGDGWTEVAHAAGSGLSGVFTSPGGPTFAVGPDAYVLEIMPDGMQVEPAMPDLAPLTAFHGVWGDSAGTTYAVGGDLFAADGPTSGVILRRR